MLRGFSARLLNSALKSDLIWQQQHTAAERREIPSGSMCENQMRLQPPSMMEHKSLCFTETASGKQFSVHLCDHFVRFTHPGSFW